MICPTSGSFCNVARGQEGPLASNVAKLQSASGSDFEGRPQGRSFSLQYPNLVIETRCRPR
jgi:hypothetical protein